MNKSDIGEFQIKVIFFIKIKLTIPKYEITKLQGESIVVFYIDMFSYITDKYWTVMRSLFNFQQLYNVLEKGFLNLPLIPNNIFTNYINQENEINRQKYNIEIFLKKILERSDLINSTYLKTFLELENNFPDYMLFQPLFLHKITSSMEVTDIIFSSNENLLFTGHGLSTSTGGFSSYLTSLSSLWDAKNLGQLGIYHMARSNYGEIHMQKLHTENLPSQVSKINYIEGENLNMLLVGLYNGTILIYKIYTNHDTYVSKDLIEQIAKIKAHSNKIIDIGIDVTVGYLYSASINEKSIVISEINYENVIKSIQITNFYITHFYYDKETKRIYVTDTGNAIYIFQVENNVKYLLNKF